MHVQPGYADQISATPSPTIAGDSVAPGIGSFHYYNNKAFFGIGLHEGDWEMIQIRLDPQSKPNVATYAQHRDAARCAWPDVEREATPDGPAPVVYSARGSHASYFRPGIYREAPVVPDYNGTEGARVRPDLVVISDRSRPGRAGPAAGGAHRNATSSKARARAGRASMSNGRIRPASTPRRAPLRTASWCRLTPHCAPRRSSLRPRGSSHAAKARGP